MGIINYRVGETNCNNKGVKMTIIKYDNARNITVLFDDGAIVQTTYSEFKSGGVKSYMSPNVCEIGYLGRIKPPIKEIYDQWERMLKRCYNQNVYGYERYGGRGVKVCEEWYNYTNFETWRIKSMWHKDFTVLDKDILFKGNKIYSPETCILVDQRISKLFVKSDGSRGNLPIGVYCRKYKESYRATCTTVENRRVHLGYFKTPEDAFYTYKEFKEEYIKKIANEYKVKYPNFPQLLYEAMCNYKVEMTD